MIGKFYILCAVCAALIAPPALGGDQPTAADVKQLHAIMQENFDACNREDVQAARATHHPAIPAYMLDRFDQESAAVFGETDVRYRIASMKIMYFENPLAPGRLRMAAIGPDKAITTSEIEIVQITLPSDHSYADLDEYPAQLSNDFRHNSALLPTHQVVVYTVKLGYNYRVKKWQILGTISKVQPITEWPGNMREVMQGQPPAVSCQNGQCPSPFINSGR